MVVFFLKSMNIYIYSDESGVFDKEHYQFFIFGGLIIADNENKEIWARKYTAAEKSVNSDNKYQGRELKGSTLSVKDKNKMFRSLNNCWKFATIIEMDKLHTEIFSSKKQKQRYLDFAFKKTIELALNDLLKEGKLRDEDVNKMYFFCDEHSTATNGVYELRQSLEETFKIGDFNDDFTQFTKPVLNYVDDVNVEFCNSKTKTLVRAADIVANHINNCAINGRDAGLAHVSNLYLYYLPSQKRLELIKNSDEI